MITSSQMTPGMTISLDGKIYRVDSCAKAAVAKGVPFMRAKLRDLMSDEVIEKNFKLNQSLQDVALAERRLEFLYLEGQDYLFLDIDHLEQVLVSAQIIGDKANFLKEGTELKAMFYGDSIFSIELPPFLEIMVLKTDSGGEASPMSNTTKSALLETGAKVEVPLFIEPGDIVKIDTQTREVIQRV